MQILLQNNFKNHTTFGMLLPERTWTSDSASYRYGFNTQERDDEIYGEGNSTTAEYWQYDSRLGRRWNVDPKPNPRISVYLAFANNPLLYNDISGDTVFINATGGVGVAIDVITKNVVVQKFINQFAVANSGSPFFSASTGQYGNTTNLTINRVDRTSALGLGMIAGNQDALVTITYNLSDGTTVDANSYVARAGVTVAFVGIILNVLDVDAPVPGDAQSTGNYNTGMAAAGSSLITNMLFTTISNFMTLIENNTISGVVDFTAVSTAYAGTGTVTASADLARAIDLFTKLGLDNIHYFSSLLSKIFLNTNKLF